MTTEVLNADGGSATASVCACSLALLDAGVNIKSSIGAVTVGLINTDSLVDITNLETSLSDAEMKIAVCTLFICRNHTPLRLQSME